MEAAAAAPPPPPPAARNPPLSDQKPPSPPPRRPGCWGALTSMVCGAAACGRGAATEARREAESLVGAGRFAEAMAACERGAGAVAANPHLRDQLFKGLSDKIALAAAAAGDLSVGFGAGRRLVVRPADAADAWLGLPAPPLLETASSQSLPLQQLSHAAGSIGGTNLSTSNTAAATAAATGSSGCINSTSASQQQLIDAVNQHQQQVLEFRSLEDALAAALDGDEITLLPGTHNVRASGGLTIEQRILMRCSASATPVSSSRGRQQQEEQGASAAPPPLRAAVVDYRGNSPLFRILRPCVLWGFEIDAVGFAPAILIEGPTSTAPLLKGLVVASSGEDAVSIGGAAWPRLICCRLSGRKAGCRAYGRAYATLSACCLESCGGPGLLLQESSHARLDRCKLSDCADDGIALSEAARVELRRVVITGCGGAAVDASGGTRVTLRDCELTGCAGGLWLWDTAHAHAERTLISGGLGFAVLLDAKAHATSGGANQVEGTVLVAEPWDGPAAVARLRAAAAGGGVGAGGAGSAAEAAAARLRAAAAVGGAGVGAAGAADDSAAAAAASGAAGSGAGAGRGAGAGGGPGAEAPAGDQEAAGAETGEDGTSANATPRGATAAPGGTLNGRPGGSPGGGGSAGSSGSAEGGGDGGNSAVTRGSSAGGGGSNGSGGGSSNGGVGDSNGSGVTSPDGGVNSSSSGSSTVCELLVKPEMVTRDPWAKAAAFPPEAGPFVYQPAPYAAL